MKKRRKTLIKIIFTSCCKLRIVSLALFNLRRRLSICDSVLQRCPSNADICKDVTCCEIYLQYVYDMIFLDFIPQNVNENVRTFLFCCVFAAFNEATSTFRFTFSCSIVINVFRKSSSINKIHV